MELFPKVEEDLSKQVEALKDRDRQATGTISNHATAAQYATLKDQLGHAFNNRSFEEMRRLSLVAGSHNNPLRKDFYDFIPELQDRYRQECIAW